MKLIWEIEKSDIQKFKNFYKAHKKNKFVKHRINRNVKKKNIKKISKSVFWHAMVSCLLTTQQRSGPESKVNKFICTKPFLLNYIKCRKAKNQKKLVINTIDKFKGIRRGAMIAKEVEHNLKFLENGGWERILSINKKIYNNQSPKTERKAAEIIISNLKGFGPKQSRNLLQSLGLTKYEIPIDSRITKWLNDELVFPIKLSATVLGDENYYNFVLDKFQEICKASNVYPCVMDAVIFSSNDEEKWDEKNLIW